MPELSSLPKYYTVLVGYVDDAITALEHGDDIKAKTLLIQGLGEAEEIYLEMWVDGEDGQSGQHDSGDETENSPKYYSWQADRTLEESGALEMEHLFHKSFEAFQELIRTQETRPEDPPLPPPNH